MRLIIFLAVCSVASGQTKINLSTQSNGDLSGAASTKPARTGSGAPSSPCGAGEMYFSTNATAGQNLYLCGSVNTWTQLTGTGGGGGSGAVRSRDLNDLATALTSSTVITIGGACSVSEPCNVRFGAATVSITTPATITLPGGATGGTVYGFVESSTGQIQVWSTISGTAAVCSGCTIVVPTQFPSDSVPLFSWTAAFGLWDTLGYTDLRAFLSNRSSIAPGAGIVLVDAPGQIIISADTSIVGVRVAVPSTSSSTCAQGNYAADGSFFYQCISANTWRRVAVASW